MTCIYCGEKTSATGLVRNACKWCVETAQKLRQYQGHPPFDRWGHQPFRWQGVSWFKWRGQWRVQA